MKLFRCVFLGTVSFFVVTACNAAGFLKAESFPSTFQDLSFETRMEVLAAGYDDLGVEYDENGRCVSGCAYAGITLEEEEYLISVAEEELQQLVAQEQQQPQESQQNVAGAPVTMTTSNALSSVTSTELVGNSTFFQPQQQQPQESQQNVAVVPVTMPISSVTSTELVGNSTFFQPPVRNNVIVVSDFGERRPPKTKNGSGSRYHRGLDLRAPTGTPLYAAANGVVVEAGWRSGYGNAVIVEHPFKTSNKTVKTLYGHLSSMNVKKGDVVKQGDLVGKAGNTGNSGGAHLHYELRFNDMRVDPLGARIKPLLDSGVAAAAATSGTNYLGSDYCFKSGITSKRLAPYVGNDAALRENFPGCRGWCR